MSSFGDLITEAGSMIGVIGSAITAFAAASFIVFTPAALSVTKTVASTAKSFFFYRRGRRR